MGGLEERHNIGRSLLHDQRRLACPPGNVQVQPSSLVPLLNINPFSDPAMKFPSITRTSFSRTEDGRPLPKESGVTMNEMDVFPCVGSEFCATSSLCGR
jgi:hypothetical protein